MTERYPVEDESRSNPFFTQFAEYHGINPPEVVVRLGVHSMIVARETIARQMNPMLDAASNGMFSGVGTLDIGHIYTGSAYVMTQLDELGAGPYIASNMIAEKLDTPDDRTLVLGFARGWLVFDQLISDRYDAETSQEQDKIQKAQNRAAFVIRRLLQPT